VGSGGVWYCVMMCDICDIVFMPLFFLVILLSHRQRYSHKRIRIYNPSHTYHSILRVTLLPSRYVLNTHITTMEASDSDNSMKAIVLRETYQVRVPCCTAQHNTLQYYTVLNCTMLYSALLVLSRMHGIRWQDLSYFNYLLTILSKTVSFRILFDH
jgi:hypothetical protein